MTSMLERARAGHEETERLERLVARDFHAEAGTHRARLAQAHRVAQCVEAIAARSAELLEYYADEDDTRAEEIAGLGGPNPFTAFYARLRELREYHRRHPGLPAALPEAQERAHLAANPAPEFSGEEGYGRYLDLQEHYRRFRAQKHGAGMEYIDYLAAFARFDALPVAARMRRGFRQYAAALLAYLEDFLRRVQPISALTHSEAAAAAEFQAAWARGHLRRGAADAADAADAAAAANGNGNGAAVPALPPPEAAAPPTTTSAAAAGKKGKGKRGREAATEMSEEAARVEWRIGRLAQALHRQVEATKTRTSRKATQTYEEIEEELADEDREEADADADADDDADDDDDEVLYNPLKLPLGWDGKPIPFWLYKLHGLNQEFKCEICGNVSIWGRRAYERHFGEPQHQHGMRCLGIPSLKIFHGITQIADAQALWQAHQASTTDAAKALDEEEFEDGDGNVYNKKTYEDLRRQGLI